MAKHVNARNAAAIRESILKGSYETDTATAVEDKPAPVPDDVRDPALVSDQGGDEGVHEPEVKPDDEPPQPEVKPEPEPEAPKARVVPEGYYSQAEHDELKKQLVKMERQFKAIQSSITPTQQENARLRKEVSELRTALDTAKPEPGKSPQASSEPNWNEIESVFPEGVGLVRSLYEQNQALQKRLDQIETKTAPAKQDAPKASPEQEALMNMAVSHVLREHPDAREVSGSPEFRDWVNAHGQAAEYMWALLNQPWISETAPYEVSDYFSAFKRDAVAPAPATPAPQPPKQAPPSPVARPSDMAVDLKTQTSVGTRPNGDEGRLLNDQQWEALNRELNKNSTTLKRKIEIRGIMRDQMALQARLRTRGRNS